MKRFAVFLLAAGLFYLASGFYVVRGNEKAAVRLFGRACGVPTADCNSKRAVCTTHSPGLFRKSPEQTPDG